MKLFIDTANVADIREAAELGAVGGATTNPTLIAREGRRFEDVIAEISEIVEGPVFAEVVSSDHEGMVSEAEKLAAIRENVVIKIPMCSEGLKAVKILACRNIKTNMTLVFSPAQALLAALAGASYVSPFLGRLDDIGSEGIGLIRDIVAVFSHMEKRPEIIAASIRGPMHVIDAAKAGCDIATVPPKVIWQMISHPLTDSGIAKFMKDWDAHTARQ